MRRACLPWHPQLMPNGKERRQVGWGAIKSCKVLSAKLL
jgi:hypothetical protein